MGENSVDFDLAIDKFFEHFAEDPEVCERRSPNLHPNNRLPNHGQEGVVKNMTTFMIPKVMKNDIRRYYGRMLMNTINSGDFNRLQSYFSTFVRRNTNFLVHYDNFDPTYRIPTRISADGPKLMSHYFLGIFVIYPDVVMSMDNTVITTSNSWSGTKIEMNVGFNATKIYDLPYDEWVPPLHILEEKCKKLTEEKRNEVQDSAGWSIDRSSTDAQRRNVQKSYHFSLPSSTSPFPPCSSIVDPVVVSGCCSEVRPVQLYPDHTNFHSSQSREQPQEDIYANNIVADSTARKRKRLLSALKDTALPSVNTDTATLPYVSHSNENHISDEYVRALCTQATLVSKPMEVRMTGTITMFLDENNHIQHMNMKVRQT